MKTWKFAFALGLCAVGVLIFLMLQLPNNEAGEPPTTASYVDNVECATCHSGKNTSWSGTLHASAYPVPYSGGNPDCKPCHTTGAGNPSIYPATGYNNVTNLPVYLQNVTCQACHGPGSEHVAADGGKPTIGLVLNSSLCGACHYSEDGLSGEHHPTYNEWIESGHNTGATLPSYVKRAACAKCHEAWNIIKFIETGYENSTVLRQPGEDAPATWEIGCPACHDPHDDTEPYQLRAPRDEICAMCHNSEGAAPGAVPHHPMAEMRNNTAGYGIDRTDAEYMPTVPCYECHLGENPVSGLPNHTFDPNPWSCVSACHTDTFPSNASARAYIDMIRGLTEGQVAGVEPVVEEAREAIAQMRGNRTSENLATWMNEYNISTFNLESVVSDSSGGNHNPVLATRLLDDAMERAQEILANLTPPDKVTGIQVTRMDDGSIVVSWSANGASDFVKYRVYVLTTAKSNITSETANAEVTNRTTLTTTMTGLDKDTAYYVYVTAVDSDGNEITNGVAPVSAGKVATPPPAPEEEKGLSTLDYGLIGLVVALAVIAALLGMMLMRKGKGEKPSETPAKTEE